MQVNLYSNIASKINTQVSNKKAEEGTKESNVQSASSSKDLNKEVLDKLSSLGGKGITQLYMMDFQQQTMNAVFGNTNAQSDLLGILNSDASLAHSILSKIDFASLGYQGKNPLAMDQKELEELVSEKGFFGVDNTANRIADFVINGAGDDIEKLKKGLEGMKNGFAQAEKMWGGSLPQISQDTIDKALEKVSTRINELGGKTLDMKA